MARRARQTTTAQRRRILARLRNEQARQRGLLTGIRQGAGAVVRRPLAAGRARRGSYKQYLDANHPAHLPLPRPIAPYSVVRTTRTFKTSNALMFFAPVRDGGDNWTNVCALGWINDTLACNAVNNAERFVFTMGGSVSGWEDSEVAPHAFTVQVMNGNALQTTAGIMSGAVCSTQLSLAGKGALPVQGFAGELISYNKPRLMSAGKLALRGVKADLPPSDMSELANFTVINEEADVVFTMGTNLANETFDGFLPAFIYNPTVGGAPGPELTYFVTCEWKVRFSPGNPAMAAHRLHKPGTMAQWDSAIKSVASIGSGIRDIAVEVAETGEAIASTAALF